MEETFSFSLCLPLQGRGFSKAMTAKEAQAFVGDVPCLVNTLQDDKLFLDPPSTPPRARSRRHRRDTRPELLDLTVRSDKDRHADLQMRAFMHHKS